VTPRSLAQRVHPHVPLDLRHRLGVLSGLEQAPEAQLLRLHPKLVQADRLGLRPVLVGHISQRWAPPPREPPLEIPQRPLWIAIHRRRRRRNLRLEQGRIDHVTVEPQPVPLRATHQQPRAVCPGLARAGHAAERGRSGPSGPGSSAAPRRRTTPQPRADRHSASHPPRPAAPATADAADAPTAHTVPRPRRRPPGGRGSRIAHTPLLAASSNHRCSVPATLQRRFGSLVSPSRHADDKHTKAVSGW
jgi:hypothetical protein